MKPSSSQSQEGPRPEMFPVGSAESRAAARAMLAPREQFILQIAYLGFGCNVTYIFDESGMRKIGREPTLEEFLAHPALQRCNIEALKQGT